MINTSKELIYILGVPIDGSGVYHVKVLAAVGTGAVCASPELKDSLSEMVSEVSRVFPFAAYIPIVWSCLLFTIIVSRIIDSMSEYSSTEISADLLMPVSECIFLSEYLMLLRYETIYSMVLPGLCVMTSVLGLFYFTHCKTVWSHILIN